MYEVCIVTGKQRLGGKHWTDWTNLDLNCNDFFPMNGSTHSNSFLGARACIFFSMKTWFKYLLIQTSIKLPG